MKSCGERERFASVIGDKGANEGADGDERVSYSELFSFANARRIIVISPPVGVVSSCCAKVRTPCTCFRIRSLCFYRNGGIIIERHVT